MKRLRNKVIGLLVLPLLIAAVGGQASAWDIVGLTTHHGATGSADNDFRAGEPFYINIEFSGDLDVSKARVAIYQKYPTNEMGGPDCTTSWDETKYLRENTSMWITEFNNDSLVIWTHVNNHAEYKKQEKNVKVYVSVLANWQYRHATIEYEVDGREPWIEACEQYF